MSRRLKSSTANLLKISNVLRILDNPEYHVLCHSALRDGNSVGKPKQRAIQTCLGNLGDFSCGTYVEVKRKVENFCFLKNELLIPIFDLFVRYPVYEPHTEELHCKSDHEVL